MTGEVVAQLVGEGLGHLELRSQAQDNSLAPTLIEAHRLAR